ncbi:MAG: DUF4389 domain-containing protein [Dehalococcoidia bacterium]
MSLSVDYPDRGLNRATTFVRILLLAPIVAFFVILVDQIVLVFVAAATLVWDTAEWRHEFFLAGFIALPTALMLLFRHKYPKWWFDWNLAQSRLLTRIWAYLTLLTDEFPSVDEDQSVHLEIPYPNAREDLNRWLPLVKWILAIPHWICLLCLGIGAVVAVLAAWLAILITGRYPVVLFDYVVGVFRWFLRVGVYAIILSTDQYPPFRFRY